MRGDAIHYAIFSVPLHHTSDGPAQELNSFLASHRILHVETQFLADGSRSCWCFLVSYSSHDAPREGQKHKRIDYREVLDDEQFKLYARLRDLRKRLSERDGVAPYIVFTNEQLAAMVTGIVRSKSAMGAISGIGAARLEKYADEFLAALQQQAPTPTDAPEDAS